MTQSTMKILSLCLLPFLIGFLAVPTFADEETTKPAAEEKLADFTFDLHRALAAKDGHENLAFSPFAIRTGLALLGSGAAGTTEREIATVLGIDGDWAQYAASLRFGAETPESFGSATALWTQKGSPFLQTFLDSAAKDFDATLGELDFTQSEAVREINRWCETKTGGRIPVLFDKLDATARCVLAVAVHFDGRWKTPFDPYNTLGGIFTLQDGTEERTNFMSRTGPFQYGTISEATILEIPYTTKGYSMLILLPGKHDGLVRLEKEISSRKLDQWCENLAETTIDLKLPRFAMENDLRLNDALSTLGMPVAFGKDADFSKMNALRNLYLGEFRQRSFVQVDERGTEAAAAAGAVVAVKSAALDVKPFHANRPFLYLICKADAEKKTRTVLFLGRFVKPIAAVETEEPVVPSLADPSLSGEGGSFN